MFTFQNMKMEGFFLHKGELCWVLIFKLVLKAFGVLEKVDERTYRPFASIYSFVERNELV